MLYKWHLSHNLLPLPQFSFPQATNQTLLDKFKHQHEENSYIEFPAVMEPAFIIKHYAGKVKYGVKVSKFLTEYGFRAEVCLLNYRTFFIPWQFLHVNIVYVLIFFFPLFPPPDNVSLLQT